MATNSNVISTSIASQGMSGAVSILLLYIMNAFKLPAMDPTTVAAFVVVVGGLMRYVVSLEILPQPHFKPEVPTPVAVPPGSAPSPSPLTPSDA
jgi:hypothetical protein